MGLPSIDHRKVVTELIERLPDEGAAGGDTLKAWTKAIKHVMHHLIGVHLDPSTKWEFCGTYTTEDNSQCLEWMLDVAWYVKDEHQEGIVLALESEWDSKPQELLADFTKLLATKAPVKIFIFTADQRKLSSLFDPLQKTLLRWQQHSPGDAVYLIEFSKAKHETWFCEVGAIPLSSPLVLERVAELSGPDHRSPLPISQATGSQPA
jgi:hypothetical protein